MFYNAPNSAMFLRRASMGPAAIAAQKENFQNINRGLPQKRYIDAQMLRRGGSLGALGDGMPGTTGAVVSGVRSLISAPKTEGAVSKIEDASHAAGAAVTSATAAGAASSAIAAMGYGAVAGPIGAAVGLVVGLAIGALTKKNYANLAQINALMDREVATLDAYQKVAGKAAGRHYGLKAMEAVWRGGIQRGLFPKMQSKMHYHEGWTKYIGGAEQASKVIREAFPRALPKFRAWKNSNISNIPTTTVAPRMAMIMRGRMNGLGALGDASGGQPDAVAFVENFLRLDSDTDIPPTTTGGPAAMQIVYDTADAYLASIPGLVTTPYIPLLPKLAPPVTKSVAKIVPRVVAPVAKITVAPRVVSTAGARQAVDPLPPYAGTSFPVNAPPSNSGGSGGTMSAPAIGAPPAAGSPAAGKPAAGSPAGTVSNVITAASGIPWGPLLTIAAAVIGMSKK